LLGLLGAGLLVACTAAPATPPPSPPLPSATPAPTPLAPTAVLLSPTAALRPPASAALSPPASAAGEVPIVVGQGAQQLRGQGSTFALPLYNLWFQQYTKLHPTVAFSYQPDGSGAGLAALQQGHVDFAASDIPPAAGAPPGLVQIPAVAGAVVLAYQGTGLPPGLVLDGDTAAAIFSGQIQQWNDPAIMALNPGVALPGTPIRIVHRADASGTTAIFTSYLAHVNSNWQGTIGSGETVAWPVGQAAAGSAGVVARLQQTDGALGYMGLTTAVQARLAYARLKNQAGSVVEATVESIGAAGDDLQGDLGASVVNSPDPESWPIVGFTYLVVDHDLHTLPDGAHAQALVDFLSWTAQDGQRSVEDLFYASPNAAVQTQIKAILRTLTYRGQPLAVP
ncbi:MAG TPA: phosphate ABC transporter substrate-binding protein PstS, partial [Chloroflexia bacterium]|nr:phosphate ABC transporter substrate-binding protein PstS [Chloroflexia bacterium]